MDALDFLKKIEDKSINLIVTDPPYNIGKDTWDKKENYIQWLGNIFKECQRILKDNGSFYFFHNDFLQMVELQNYINKNTNFIFKQFIVWNKKFKGAKTEGFLQGFNEPEMLRNYQKMAEYILYYTFQDETGLTTVMLDTNNFSTLRQYFKEIQEFIGLNIKKINNKIGHRKSEHCFYWKTTQWDVPTKETYDELINVFNINKMNGFKEYEDLRCTFNNQKTHHSVWNYEIEKKQGHITPKPIKLIKNIILHSSNKNDTILDCFMGSGTTAIASIQTNRKFIGCDNSQEYIDLANARIKKELEQKRLF